MTLAVAPTTIAVEAVATSIAVPAVAVAEPAASFPTLDQAKAAAILLSLDSVKGTGGRIPRAFELAFDQKVETGVRVASLVQLVEFVSENHAASMAYQHNRDCWVAQDTLEYYTSSEQAKAAVITLGLDQVNDPKGHTGVDGALKLAFSPFVDAGTRAASAKVLLDYVEVNQSGGVAFQYNQSLTAAHDALGKYASQQQAVAVGRGDLSPA